VSLQPSPRILLLSTSDTDLITARASGADFRWANPSRLLLDDVDELLSGADVVVIRILGGFRAWEDGISAVVASGVPTVVVSGEQAPDADLMDRSTVPAGIALQTHVYLAQGGVENLRQLYAFLCDTVLMTGIGFEPPVSTPTWGLLDRSDSAESSINPDGPTVAVLFYRAQQLAGNTAYVEALCQAIDAAGGRAMPIYCASLRTPAPELMELLTTADAMVVTVLAAGERYRPRRVPVVTTKRGASNILLRWTFRSCKAYA
jgi:cobaltochelatase CobN